MFNNIPIIGNAIVMLEYAIVPMGQALYQIPFEIFEAAVCCCDCRKSKKKVVINKVPQPVMTLSTPEELEKAAKKELRLKSLQEKFGKDIFVPKDRFSKDESCF